MSYEGPTMNHTMHEHAQHIHTKYTHERIRIHTYDQYKCGKVIPPCYSCREWLSQDSLPSPSTLAPLGMTNIVGITNYTPRKWPPSHHGVT